MSEWTLRNLQANVQYCVQSVGMYRVIEGLRIEPEITCGESVLITTDGKRTFVYKVESCCVYSTLLNVLPCSGCPRSPSDWNKTRHGPHIGVEKTSTTRTDDLTLHSRSYVSKLVQCSKI